MTFLRFDSGADRDVTQSIAWYRKRSFSAPDRFLSEIEETVVRIQSSPLQFPPSHYGCRVAQLRKFPHLIHFVVGTEQVTIVAVAHPLRKTSYFAKRLKRIDPTT